MYVSALVSVYVREYVSARMMNDWRVCVYIIYIYIYIHIYIIYIYIYIIYRYMCMSDLYRTWGIEVR